ERLAAAAAEREDVLHGLAVQSPEDVDEAGAVLAEVGRAVGGDGGALDAADRVGLGLDRAGPALPVVGRGQAPDTLCVREVELDRAVRLLHELRPAGDRVA